MIKLGEIRVAPQYDEEQLLFAAAKRLNIDRGTIKSLRLLRKSLDARKKSDIHYTLTVAVELSERDEQRLLRKRAELEKYQPYVPPKRDIVQLSYRPVVIGFGPAGIFAALTLAKCGARPIVLERGQDADLRKLAVEKFWSGGALNPDSNVQFGEGGAGAFSDGKLTSGVKNPFVSEVFHEFVASGAPEEILYLAKPHIGTDRLLPTVKQLRRRIIELGGEVRFNCKVTDIYDNNGGISSIIYEREDKQFELKTNAAILAVGHSARDIFALLERKNHSLAPKSFAVGMRIEHRQTDLNRAMYGDFADKLPPADYKLAVHLPSGRGVFTFCMCPGGQVVASASEPQTVVTNGMSLFARDGENANSAVLVEVRPTDFSGKSPLAGVEFQREIEQAAFRATGGFPPAIKVGDFLQIRSPSEFGSVTPSIEPAARPTSPERYLPSFVTESIRTAIPMFARKISCFADPNAVLTGPESRSSSPVRILRDEGQESLSLRGLYPCGEGAGYAGGIVSAATDGIRCALSLLKKYE